MIGVGVEVSKKNILYWFIEGQFTHFDMPRDPMMSLALNELI
jgi:hypothetical protein